MDQQKVKYFTTNLRRVLYLSQIMKYELESLKGLDVTPFYIKDGCKRTENAINAFLSNCMTRTSPENWALVRSDLANDQLHDLNLLLDTMIDVKNVGEIVEVLQTVKKGYAVE